MKLAERNLLKRGARRCKTGSDCLMRGGATGRGKRVSEGPPVERTKKRGAKQGFARNKSVGRPLGVPP